MSGLRLVLIASLLILLRMGRLARFGSIVAVSPTKLLGLRLVPSVGLTAV